MENHFLGETEKRERKSYSPCERVGGERKPNCLKVGLREGGGTRSGRINPSKQKKGDSRGFFTRWRGLKGENKSLQKRRLVLTVEGK